MIRSLGALGGGEVQKPGENTGEQSFRMGDIEMVRMGYFVLYGIKIWDIQTERRERTSLDAITAGRFNNVMKTKKKPSRKNIHAAFSC